MARNHIYILCRGIGTKFDAANIEDKAQTTDEIHKEVIAFANTDGGMVDIGFDNDGDSIIDYMEHSIDEETQERMVIILRCSIL